MRPVLILVTAALIGALAYVALGPGSTTPATPTAASSSPKSSGPPAIAVSAAPANLDRSIAETTSGSSKQRQGRSRDPFTPLPGTVTTSSSPSGSAGSSKSSAGGKSGSGSKGESVATTPAKPTPPPSSHVVVRFQVNIEFGVVPPAPSPGAPPPPALLKASNDIKLNEPFPSKENSQLVYLGVVLSTGKDAVFGLTGEVILHGNAKCLPSPAHCQAIQLQAGQSETLESFEANGTSVTYELKLISITRSVG